MPEFEKVSSEFFIFKKDSSLIVETDIAKNILINKLNFKFVNVVNNSINTLFLTQTPKIKEVQKDLSKFSGKANELEKNKRKLYAGGIGYFTPNGEFDTCIALRTALIKNNKFYVQAGAGVVADSKPEKEYAETVNKAKALMRAVD